MRYSYDTYVNDYEWFIRADDDVYIKGDKLNGFLRDLNSSKPMYIGVPGRGKEHELGVLGLKAEDNYCMGGPGMIFSRETIRRVGPNIHQCLKDLYSDHEDVEIGRCIRRFARVNCTWNYEMADYFYQNYADYHGSYTNKGALENTHKAMTLHPIKQPPHMFRIHNYFLGIRVYEKRARVTHLLEDVAVCLDGISEQISNDQLPRHRDNIAPWTFMDKKRIFDPLTIHPAKGLHLHPFHDAYPIIKNIIFNIENRNRTNNNEMNKKFYHFEQGYMRVNGKFSAQYLMQFLVESKYKNNKLYAATRPVDYRLLLTQPFQELEIRISDYPNVADNSETTRVDNAIVPSKTINFIMPLSGRLSTFIRFIGMIEDICFRYNEDVTLTIVQYAHPENDSRADVIQTVGTLRLRYPQYSDRLKVVSVEGPFTRGGGLTVGSDSLSNNSLMYFIDVDIMLTRDTLNRIRSNTIQYRQAYYPVVFSQYDPDAACQKPRCPRDSFQLTRYNGYWRAFGFGIAAMFKTDLNIVGGFDRSIVGWGKEDVDLFEKFVKSNITVFRTTDKGQVHIFHKILCDPNLEASQFRMCFNTKAASYASMYALSERVYTQKVLYDFDVSAFNFSKMVKPTPKAPMPAVKPVQATAAPPAVINKSNASKATSSTNSTASPKSNTVSNAAKSTMKPTTTASTKSLPTTPAPKTTTTTKSPAITQPTTALSATSGGLQATKNTTIVPVLKGPPAVGAVGEGSPSVIDNKIPQVRGNTTTSPPLLTITNSSIVQTPGAKN